MPLINCKIKLSLKWYEKCILAGAENNATFTITDTKPYVPIVTLKIEDNTILSKLISKGFKRLIYWNKDKVIFKSCNADDYIRERLDASFEGVNKLFVLAYASGNNVTDENSYRRYFLPRHKMENYNIKIDGRNFYDESINDLIRQYDEIRKISAGQGYDYTTGCLLDFSYFEKNYRLITAVLSKQKAFKSNSRKYFYWKDR